MADEVDGIVTVTGMMEYREIGSLVTSLANLVNAGKKVK